MYIDDFAGRGASVWGLCAGFLAGAPVHAALITGPQGVGKRTLAGLLAQRLFCTGEGKMPCGQCPGCRKVISGSHADVHRIPAQKRVGVDTVRELTAALSAAAYEGGYRAAIIEEAGAMTTQAQNSLLKTLEEPPARTVFLLTCVSVTQMLETIRSRCSVAHLPPMDASQVQALLTARGIDASRAQTLAALSSGSIGEALSMDTDEHFWALRERTYGTMAALGGAGDVLGAVNALKDDRTEAQRVCALLEEAFRAALRERLSVPAQPLAWPQLARLSACQLLRHAEGVRTLRRMLASNVPWQAALERFLLEYSEDLH